MVALKTSDADAFVKRPDAGKPVVLVYGPDSGLVGERARALINSAVDDPNDPFQLVRIDGDELNGNPLRLVEEANTIPLFGGKRAVWVKASSRSNLAPAVEALLGAAPPDCRVVIEAGDLRKTAPLRSLVEKAKNAAALPCYEDNTASLGKLIDDEMGEAGLTIAPDARAALLPFLGGDRQASRNEIRKLALYAHGSGKVTLDDVVAVVADASALALDGAIDSAFAGRLPDVEMHFARAMNAGTSPGTIMSAALRQVSQLHKARLAMDEGSSIDQALYEFRPPVHFSRKTVVEAALRAWTSERLLGLMQQLAAAVLETRRQAPLAETIAQRALMSIAMSARRKSA
jgi:DNA polymerase-3 subunit delta